MRNNSIYRISFYPPYMGSKYTKENTNKLIETTVFSNKIGRMPLPSKACSP